MNRFTMTAAGVLLTLASTRAQAGSSNSPRARLNESIERLQKTPDDADLREKIIKLAKSVKPAPAVPEEARRHFVKAVTLQKEAKAAEDYDLPIREYRQALLLAPWWSDAYYNLSSALELKLQYADAIQSLRLSILANPEGADARAAQDKIYALEAKSEKANSQENSPAAKLDKFYKSLDGGRWERRSTHAHNYRNGSDWPETSTADSDVYLEVRGHELTSYPRHFDGDRCISKCYATSFDSREFETVATMAGGSEAKVRITISDDGQSIAEESWAQPQPSMYWKAVYKRIK